MAAVSCAACDNETPCYGISGKDALDFAVSIQQQSRENPAYAHEGVPITELRPALILTDSTYGKGDPNSATKVLFVDPKTGRRLRYLEIFADCDPEWRIYSGPDFVNGVAFDRWDAAEPVSSLQ